MGFFKICSFKILEVVKWKGRNWIQVVFFWQKKRPMPLIHVSHDQHSLSITVIIQKYPTS